MKQKILLLILMFSSLLIYGQNGNFKKKIKYPSGTTPRANQYIQIKGNNSIKSTGNARVYYILTNLKRPNDYRDDKDFKKIIFKSNSPVYIEKELSKLKSTTNLTIEERFYSFIEATKSITKVSNPIETFVITDIQTDTLGITHIKSIQLYKGIEIYGSKSNLHIDSEKERFTGRFHNINQDIQITPK